jgi:hypothetical protein
MKTAVQRFHQMYVINSITGCWLWRSVDHGGYARHWVNGRTVSAHRFAYEAFIGSIPDGLTLDHKCHTTDLACAGGRECQHRSCVNPAHLEPVTMQVNLLRGRGFPARNAKKTHCSNGHPFDVVNTFMVGNRRRCRACEDARMRTPEYRRAGAERRRRHRARQRVAA